MKSMSSLIQLLLLHLLCLSLHACTARPVTATQKETQKYRFHKVLDQMKLSEKLSRSKLKQAKQQKVVNGSASNLKQLILGTTSEHEVPSAISSVRMGTTFFKNKELRRHAQSLVGAAHGHAEQTVNPNGGDAAEDIVEMDYAQPHRKPPIHN